jgi:hypothetical protein
MTPGIACPIHRRGLGAGAEESSRSKLLYGEWTTADGTVVLFDRKYRPRWRRTPDGIVTPADPSKWIDDILQEAWFYTERASLTDREQINARIAAEWRLA